MADTRASVSDTTDAPDANDTTDASDSSADSAADEVSTVVVLAIKSRRIGHLSAGAKRILGYLSAWQLSLIACNLLLMVSSGAMHTRPHLVLPGRHFYCLYWHFTLALALWDGFSVAVLVRRRPDNLNTITLLSTSGLLLILMDVFILCQLLLPPPLGHYHSSGTKTKSENISGKSREDEEGTNTNIESVTVSSICSSALYLLSHTHTSAVENNTHSQPVSFHHRLCRLGVMRVTDSIKIDSVVMIASHCW